jgi:hypothetical protein
MSSDPRVSTEQDPRANEEWENILFVVVGILVIVGTCLAMT